MGTTAFHARPFWNARLGLLGTLFLGMIALPSVGRASAMNLPITPSNAVMELRAYGLGLIPITISVGRFSGMFAYDPAQPQRCAARFTAEVSSMHTADPDRQARLLGPDFMDAARYPTLSFAGTCGSHSELSGALTMHGATQPFHLDLDWQGHRLTAEGQVRRVLWGITSMPLLIGPAIHVTIVANLPALGR